MKILIVPQVNNVWGRNKYISIAAVSNAWLAVPEKISFVAVRKRE
jgi:hypothetical protein